MILTKTQIILKIILKCKIRRDSKTHIFLITDKFCVSLPANSFPTIEIGTTQKAKIILC